MLVSERFDDFPLLLYVLLVLFPFIVRTFMIDLISTLPCRAPLLVDKVEAEAGNTLHQTKQV